MKISKKFDNSKRSVWQTLLRFVVLAPFCMAFLPAGVSNPLLDSTPASAPESGAGTPNEGQSAPITPTEGTEQTTVTPETTAAPINTPSETIAPQPTDVLKNLGLDKFKDVEALGNSYKHIEQLHSKTSTENAQLKAQLDNMIRESENAKILEQQKAQQIQDSQVQTPEQIEEENLLLAEELMNNPMTAIEKIRQQVKGQIMKDVEKDVEGLKKQVMPIIEQQQRAEQQEKVNTIAMEFGNAVDDVGNKLHPEISKQEVRTAMVEAFTKFPGLSDTIEGFETAYKYALGETNSVAQPIDPNTLLSDESFMKQAALSPKIMEMATKQYLESIKNGNPPPMMGASTGGSPSALPINKPRTIAEASKAAKKIFGLG